LELEVKTANQNARPREKPTVYRPPLRLLETEKDQCRTHKM
jgi:hypothetical protein